MAGDEEFTPELRAAAEDAALHAQQIAVDRFIQVQLQLALEDLGYTVCTADPAANTAASGVLAVSGPGWGDAMLWIELSDGQMRAEIEPGAVGINASQVSKWRRVFDELRKGLADAGVRAELKEVRDNPVPRTLAHGTAPQAPPGAEHLSEGGLRVGP